jgi:hypothetical protein
MVRTENTRTEEGWVTRGGLLRALRWPIRVITFFVLLAVLLLCFFPSSLGSIWHLFHGNSTSFRGWTVPVPQGFFARHEDHVLQILRKENWSFAGGENLSELFIISAPVDNTFSYARDHDKFEALQSALASKRGLVKRSEKTVGGDSAKHCLEFAAPGLPTNADGSSLVEINCFVDDEPIAISYSGRAEFMAEMYSLIESMSRNAARKPDARSGLP